MAVKAVVPFLVAMMLVTGVCNTLLTKYQDMQCVRNCDSPNPKHRRHFQQPVIQTAQMFIGEMGCWLVVGGFALYKRYAGSSAAGGYRRVSTVADGDTPAANGDGYARVAQEDEDAADPIVKPLVAPIHAEDPAHVPLKGWRTALLAIPACCDITGTTLMNVGLLFVAASIYQMTRGALVLFTGLLSVLFLRRRLAPYKWLGLVIVVTGVAIVGLAGAIARDHKAVPSEKAAVLGGGWHHDIKAQMNSGVNMLLRIKRDTEVHSEGDTSPLAVQTIIGVLLIACAQIFTAAQFVVEERIMERYSIGPLEMVGWEGVFGFSVTVLGMIILHLAIGRTEAGRFGYFDVKEGLREITQYRTIAISSVLIMISIGGFNFFGLSVTRRLSATPRATIDTCRTLFIWLVSLGLGWETFKWLQVLGFVLLVYGTFLVNDIVAPPLKAYLGGRSRTEELLPEVPIEHN